MAQLPVLAIVILQLAQPAQLEVHGRLPRETVKISKNDLKQQQTNGRSKNNRPQQSNSHKQNHR